jgi:hypothetical protein
MPHGPGCSASSVIHAASPPLFDDGAARPHKSGESNGDEAERLVTVTGFRQTVSSFVTFVPDDAQCTVLAISGLPTQLQIFALHRPVFSMILSIAARSRRCARQG